MRVLILFSSSELGGAERSLSRMALTSTSIKYQVSTIQANGAWCDWIESQGMQPLILGKKGGILVAMVRLFHYLRSSPVNVVYVCGIRASLWIRLFRFLIPSIKLVHGVRWNPDSNSKLDLFFRFVERTTSFLVDAWITNSLAAKNTLIQRCGISEDRIYTIYNGVDSFPEQLPYFESRPLEILTIANLNTRKGHCEYLNAIQLVVQYVPDARFIFIGRDDMEGIVQKAIEKTGLEAYVRYEGFQPDVTNWLMRARLFVLPSLWGEGCPTSILEAFSFAIPVIAYEIDGVPELINHEEDGYLLPPGDSKALADHILKLLLNPLQNEAMGKNGREKIASYFTLSTCAYKHEMMFDQLVSR